MCLSHEIAVASINSTKRTPKGFQNQLESVEAWTLQFLSTTLLSCKARKHTSTSIRRYTIEKKQIKQFISIFTVAHAPDSCYNQMYTTIGCHSLPILAQTLWMRTQIFVCIQLNRWKNPGILSLWAHVWTKAIWQPNPTVWPCGRRLSTNLPASHDTSVCKNFRQRFISIIEFFWSVHLSKRFVSRGSHRSRHQLAPAFA